MATNEQMLNDYADTIRSCYCEERNRWHREHEFRESEWGVDTIAKYDGGEDKRGVVHENIWLRIARFGVEHRLDPVRFVRAQFRARSATPTEPHQLLNEHSLRLYSVQAQRDSENTVQLLVAQKTTFTLEAGRLAACRKQFGWTDTEINRSVLGNLTLSLSALFRYCVATRCGYADVAEKFFDSALIQYLSQSDDYDRVWGDLIPHGVKQAASRFAAYVANPQAGVPDPQKHEPMQREILID